MGEKTVTMRVGACVAGAVLSAACGSSVTGSGAAPETAPVVLDASPSSGDYGDTITVKGQRVLRSDVGVYATSPDGDRIELVATPNPSAIPQRDPRTNQDIPIADDAPLSFRFPFPAEGAMTLVAPQGEQPLGAFTPSWAPGHGFKLEGERILGAAPLGKDTAVLVTSLEGVSFVVFGSGVPTTVAVSGAPNAPDAHAAIHVGGAGTIEALVTDAGAVWSVAFDGTTATATKYTDIGGTLLGVGADDKGLVIVSDAGGRIARLRGPAPKAVVDGPTVPMPPMTQAVRAIAVDGSLVYAWGEHGGDVFDDKAVFSMKRLAPDAADFAPSIELDRLDDDFKSITLSQSGPYITFSYCAIDTDPFASAKDVCGQSTTYDGTAKLGGTTGAKVHALVARMTGGGAIVGDCAGGKLAVRTLAGDGTSSSAEPTISCDASFDAVLAGDAGLRVVAEASGRLWVARRRAP